MVEEVLYPQIDKAICTGCCDCIITCPTAALGFVDGGAVLVEPAACNYCGGCEIICLVTAVALPYQVVLESAS